MMISRWHAGVLTLGNSAVGSVSRGASGHWFAYGWMDDFEDTPLGAHNSEAAAKQCVEDWVAEHMEQSPKRQKGGRGG
jgi:hypothetical protein